MDSYFVQLFALFVFFIVHSTQSISSRVACPNIRLENGRTRIRARGRTIRFSCYEGFTLIGNKYATCVRGEWDTPIPACVNSNCPKPAKPEHALVASKYLGAVLIYFCEPGYMLIGNAEIYCDGKQWNGTAPSCRDTSAVAPTSCDFETPDLCWWEQDPQHDFDWQRHNFDTPSSRIGTGPTSDHTLGPGNEGYYLYIEASGRLVNDTARIISPLYNGSLTEAGCFSFWYHMYGATIGTLNVYFKPEVVNITKLMFSKSGNQGNMWHRGIFKLPVVESNFQIIIEGVRGGSYVSDIAVDDVAILQGDECIVKTEYTNNTSGDDDQVEIVHSMQTCQGRCSNSYFTTPSSGDLALSDICQCTVDCAYYSMCCPDYYYYCIIDSSDMTSVTLPITSTRIAVPTMQTMTEKSNSTYFTSKTPSHEVIPINPADGIDPYAPRAVTRNTATTMWIEVETPFSDNTQKSFPNQNTIDCEQCDNDSSVIIHHNTHHLLNGNVQLSMASIFGIVVGLLAAVSITAIVAFVILHRRKAYKRGSNGSALSEDSDVRFLTSDEVLDFNLARPSNDYDEI